MLSYPFFSLFLFTLFGRTLIALSSFHWIIVWIALELNIISFIPLMSSTNWRQESEAALKYLLFQAFGSRILLLGMSSRINYFILFGLIIKLGAAPFHFWFPSVIKGISWPIAAILITWQKIAPICLIISSFSNLKPALLRAGLVRAIVGAIGGFNQTHLRPLLAYSSIGHIGWILATSSTSPSISLFYLVSYILISIPIIWTAFISNIQKLKSTSSLSSSNSSLLILPLLISLGGLPPLIGFIPKLLALLSFSSILVPFILIISSLINLSYYLNLFIVSFLNTPSTKLKLPTPQTPFTLSFIRLLAISPLPFIFILISFRI